MAYWEFHGDLEDFERNSAISMGYSLFESIGGLSSEAIRQALLRRGNKAASKYSIGANAGQILLLQEMRVDDFVVVRDSGTRDIRICRVAGPYEFDEKARGDGHAHSYPVEWIGPRMLRDSLSGALRAALKKRMLTTRRIDDPAVVHDVQVLIGGSHQTSSAAAGSGRSPRRRSARPLAADTIRDPQDHDEGPVTGRWTDLGAALHLRRKRTSAHDRLVEAFAKALLPIEAYVGDFDLAANIAPSVLLAEMKTLDGTPEDEVRQVRHAVGQLLYYEKLSLPAELAGSPVVKVAVFDKHPSCEHIGWMGDLGIAVAWREDDEFFATQESKDLVGLSFLHTEKGA